MTRICAAFAISFVLLFGQSSAGHAADDLSTYTAIPNVVPGTSYIRLYGLEGADATFNIRAFGNQSGRELPSESLVVSANATIQHQVPMSMASPDDTSLTLYVKGTRAGLDLAGVFQHIKFNGATGEFENMSVCSINSSYTLAYSYIHYILLNVQTTIIQGYTSYVGVTNTDTKPHNYNLVVKDGATGELIGITPINVGANSSFKQPFEFIQNALGWTPTPDQPYATIEVQSTDGGGSLASHFVVNNTTGTEINMSNVCPIFPAAAAALPYTNDPCNPPDSPTVSHSEYVYGMSACGVQDWSADRTTLGRVAVDSGADAFINTVGDVDWWKVDLVKGRTYAIAVQGTIPTGVTGASAKPISGATIVLRNSAGIPIPNATVTAMVPRAGAATGLGVYTLFQYVADTTDTYFIEVSDPVNGETGSYQVSVSGVLSVN